MLTPLTLSDFLKLLWFGLTRATQAPPMPPELTVVGLKAEVDKIAESPVLVVASSDHSYRVARLHATTAILCTEKGRKPTLHEDHYPDQPPEACGFDVNEKMKVTRVSVLLVQ